jgi:hypothetical protein
MLIAGLCFAAASFFRGQMFPVAIGVSIILSIVQLVQLWPLKIKKFRLTNPMIVGTITFLLAFYLPIGSYMALNRGALLHASYVWELPFLIQEKPTTFLVTGGMRAACLADPIRCEYLHNQTKPGIILPNAKIEIIKSFLFHPINFSVFKLPIAWQFWMEGTLASESARIFVYQNVLIFILGLGCLLLMLIRKTWLFFWLTLASVALILGPPFLLHFEARYFYLTKVFILFLPFWLLFIYGATNYKNNGEKSHEARKID